LCIYSQYNPKNFKTLINQPEMNENDLMRTYKEIWLGPPPQAARQQQPPPPKRNLKKDFVAII
jgi:hypothetical protein